MCDHLPASCCAALSAVRREPSYKSMGHSDDDLERPITIDAPAESLRLHVDDSELGRRRTAWRPRTSNDTPSGMLAMYARLAGPAARGALMELEEA